MFPYTKAEVEVACGKITEEEFEFAGDSFSTEYTEKYERYGRKPDERRVIEILAASVMFYRKHKNVFAN